MLRFMLVINSVVMVISYWLRLLFVIWFKVIVQVDCIVSSLCGFVCLYCLLCMVLSCV